MGIMREDTLRRFRTDARKFDHHPTREREVALLESHLEALARIRELEARVDPKPPPHAELYACDHCGRRAGDFAGGSASITMPDEFGERVTYRVCHPNIADRPDCYQLITVYGEAIGARRPTT